MIKNYLKIAFRNLIRHKGYSFMNIAGLAIGMTCCLLLLLYVQDELGYDKYHEKADRIYRFVTDWESKDQTFPNALSSAPMAPQLLSDFPDIKEAVRFFQTNLLSKCTRRRWPGRCRYSMAQNTGAE